MAHIYSELNLGAKPRAYPNRGISTYVDKWVFHRSSSPIYYWAPTSCESEHRGIKPCRALRLGLASIYVSVASFCNDL